MVSYGLLNEEDSFDTPPAKPQNRKRTYPIAFEEPANLYPYNNAVPVAIEEVQEWSLPLGLTARSVMDCFTTALGWVQYALTEYGGKFFAAGKFNPGLC
jgi:hypothetical protein